MDKIGELWRGNTVWCMTVVQCKEKWKDQTQRFLTQTWISFTIQWETGEEEGNEECFGTQQSEDMNLFVTETCISEFEMVI